jgi:hypothetical protein
MKLLYVTQRYGDRVCITPAWQQSIFFTGRQPEMNVMLALDLPGARGGSADDVLEWLRKEAAKQAFKAGRPEPDRRALAELPERAWRRAVMDDLIDARNFDSLWYSLHLYFSFDEFVAFAEKWWPLLLEQLREAQALSEPHARATALANVQDLANRVCRVANSLPASMSSTRDRIVERLERARVDAMRATGFTARKWTAMLGEVNTPPIKHALLMELAAHIVALRGNQAYVRQCLEDLRATESLARYVRGHAQFWASLKDAVRLEPNVQDQTIDISEAQEQTVQLSWELLDARRVGRIVAGRSALVLRQGKGVTYVAGQRRLKFQVTRAGGSLQRMGNTLTTSAQGAAGLHRALLEVETIDALSNLNPAQALARLGRDLPPDHEAVALARAAVDDPRQSRILADVLIELSVGIDADVARRLARTQAAGNRKRKK